MTVPGAIALPSGATPKSMTPVIGNAHVKRLNASVDPPAPRSNSVLRVLAYSGRGPMSDARARPTCPRIDPRDPNDGENVGSHRRNGAGTLLSGCVSVF